MSDTLEATVIRSPWRYPAYGASLVFVFIGLVVAMGGPEGERSSGGLLLGASMTATGALFFVWSLRTRVEVDARSVRHWPLSRPYQEVPREDVVGVEPVPGTPAATLGLVRRDGEVVALTALSWFSGSVEPARARRLRQVLGHPVE